MKIGVVHVNTEAASGPYTELITANLERAKSDGTEVMHRYVRHLRRATDTATAYPTMLNEVDVVAEMVGLERDGADAVLVACSGDPGVAEARSVLSIPVIGPMEATLLLACSYGWRFSILTVADRTWSSNMDQMVHALGLASRYAGQRQLETPTATIFTEGFRSPELVIDDIKARARECVEDGADSIVIGSAGLGTFATNFGVSKVDDPEVPIFDAISTGFKIAELRVELKTRLGIPAISRAGWHAKFSEHDRRRVDRLFGWVDEPVQVDG
jgi:Asp/Glu/hydantoin racemase